MSQQPMTNVALDKLRRAVSDNHGSYGIDNGTVAKLIGWIDDIRTQDRNGFVQGYACAVGTLARMDGSKPPLLPTEVKELMEAGGLTRETCVLSKVDPYDMEALFGDKS